MADFRMFPADDCTTEDPAPGHAHDTGPPCGQSLTPREAVVMSLILEGLSTRLVAKRLQVRPRTVDKHVERALRKLGVRSRIEAVAILRDHAGRHD